MANAQAANGKIVQIIGSVIDVEFPREGIPAVYEALKLVDQGLTLEAASLDQMEAAWQAIKRP